MPAHTDSPNGVHWTSTEAMRPTQCAVGMLEVAFKMQELRDRARQGGNLPTYLHKHPIPAVRGPDGHMYLTDHHHMGLALVRLCEDWDASDHPAAQNPYRRCGFQLVRDDHDHPHWSMAQFFAHLESLQLCHPYDGQGRHVATIPRHLAALEDDPYRSLAGLARKAGAFDKVAQPYTEFRWADFLRTRVDATLICDAHLAQAIHQAVVLAHSASARGLPGFHGVRPSAELPGVAAIEARLAQRHGAPDDAIDLPALVP